MKHKNICLNIFFLVKIYISNYLLKKYLDDETLNTWRWRGSYEACLHNMKTLASSYYIDKYKTIVSLVIIKN